MKISHSTLQFYNAILQVIPPHFGNQGFKLIFSDLTFNFYSRPFGFKAYIFNMIQMF